DEPVLSEDSGHFRFAEDSKVSPLHPPVGPSGASDDGLMDFFLVFLRFAGDGPIEDVGFKACSASSIDVDRNEVVSPPIVSRFGPGRQTGVAVPRAGHFDCYPFVFFLQILLGGLGNFQGQIFFLKPICYGPGIGAAVSRVKENFFSHVFHFLSPHFSPRYTIPRPPIPWPPRSKSLEQHPLGRPQKSLPLLPVPGING